MFESDDKRFKELARKQAEHKTAERRLAKTSNMVYDRCVSSEKKKEEVLTVEQRCTLEIVFKSLEKN